LRRDRIEIKAIADTVKKISAKVSNVATSSPAQKESSEKNFEHKNALNALATFSKDLARGI